MKKKIRLTESDLTRIVKKIILSEAAIANAPDDVITMLQISPGEKGTISFNYDAKNGLYLTNSGNGAGLWIKPSAPQQ